MYNSDEPFQLRKRFRHEEERQYIRRPEPWNKHIIDLENGTYLGRTPRRWLYLAMFYMIFYAALIIFWGLCYMTFRGTVSNNNPKWHLKQPGFSFEPSVNSADKDLKIEYHEDQEDEVALYVDRIEHSLRKYGTIPRDYFGNCTSENEFGYKERNPCVFLKLNRIVGFKSETIERPHDLPPDAPRDFYRYLQTLTALESKGRLWVSCQSSPIATIQYIPQRFYNASVADISQAIKHEPHHMYVDHFGEDNSRFYNSLDFQRIIAVRILNVLPNLMYRIDCTLWAKNVERDFRGRVGHGRVRFNLQIKSQKVDNKFRKKQ